VYETGLTTRRGLRLAFKLQLPSPRDARNANCSGPEAHRVQLYSPVRLAEHVCIVVCLNDFRCSLCTNDSFQLHGVKFREECDGCARCGTGTSRWKQIEEVDIELLIRWWRIEDHMLTASDDIPSEEMESFGHKQELFLTMKESGSTTTQIGILRIFTCMCDREVSCLAIIPQSYIIEVGGDEHQDMTIRIGGLQLR